MSSTPPAERRLLLDLHVPDGPGPFPAAILIHGGGFDQGSKSTNRGPCSNRWRRRLRLVQHRLPACARGPFPAGQCRYDSAIRWLKANATHTMSMTSKIALIGESAGGFLVNYAGTHETPETKVAAVVDFYGPSIRKAGSIAPRSSGALRHGQHQPARRQRRRHSFLRRRTTRRGRSCQSCAPSRRSPPSTRECRPS